MFRPRYLLVVLVALLPLAVLTAQEETSSKPESGAVGTITERELRAHMGFLASEELEGRGTGDHSLNVAARYIESEFREAGIAPPPGQEGYFQEMPFSVRNLAAVPELRMSRPGEEAATRSSYRHGSEFTTMSFSDSGQVASGVVFAGYGITAPEQKYDDYAGIDVKGKVVLVLRYAPKYGDREARFVPREHAYLNTKYENAVKHGASAFLLVTGSLHSEDRAPSEARGFSRRQGRGNGEKGIPAFHVSPEVAQQILGEKKLEDIEKGMEKDLKPASFAVADVELSASVKMVETQKSVWNVIGFIEGSDPELKKEVVVVGAHYDHLGKSKTEIYYGADDNASGTSAVIEVAEAFTLAKKKPPRSMMFIAFAAEEIGLVGSRYYVEHPLVPLEDTVFMVNLDMVGRAKEDTANIGGGSMCPAVEKICRQCADAAGIEPRLGGISGGGSDHASFLGKNIPALFIISSSNPDYHTPRDTLDKINFPTMTRVAKMTYLIADAYANLKELPEVDIEALRQQQRRGRGQRPYLGVNMDDTEKGVEITEVTENSPAQEAGLKPHDIIVKVKGTEVKTRRNLYEALRGLKVGDKIEVEILRSGEKKTIELTLGRRPARR